MTSQLEKFTTFTISAEPYYDPYTQQYKNVLMVNIEPPGPLRLYIRRLRMDRLSPYHQVSRDVWRQCGLAIVSLQLAGASFVPINYIGFEYPVINPNPSIICNAELMTPDEIPILITFLQANGYQIETQITNMLNNSNFRQRNDKLVFTVTYYGANQPNIVYMR
jgi:hypothetical protein